MEKMPSTSYVRLVDIWLICGQLIPFIEVILLTLMELYNEVDVINHHGMARRVSSIFQVSFKFWSALNSLINVLPLILYLFVFVCRGGCTELCNM